MNLAQWTSAVKLATLALSLLAFYKAYRQLKKVPDLRKIAMKRFREFSNTANTMDLKFDGANAEIILVETTGVDQETFTCAIYARNPTGQYFVFRSSASGESIKHIEPRIAKLVLKERFVQPKGKGE